MARQVFSNDVGNQGDGRLSADRDGRSPSGRAATASPPSPETVSGIAGIPNAGAPLTAEDAALLEPGDILLHRTGERFMFGGRIKVWEGPARLEVREVAVPSRGWRLISYPAFTFLHRPAQAIEARRAAAAKTDAVEDESAVAESDAPTPPPVHP